MKKKPLPPALLPTLGQTNLFKYKYIDLFAGCGGLSLGLHQAGWQGVFAVEKSPDAFETIKHNLIDNNQHFDWPTWLPKTPLDIDQVINKYAAELKALKGTIDMVAGGPPCQGFSMAGRRNENDKRNGLVESYISFIKLVLPKVIFFENVKGFTLEFKKNKDKGKQYATYVEEALDKAGYYVKGSLVNFGDYGVPQRRTRFILVGIRKDVAGDRTELAASFFSKIDHNKAAFLKGLGLTVDTNLGDAISDLLYEHGTVESPDMKRFKAGIYAENQTSYQKLMRGRGPIHKLAIDSHRFANHKPTTVEKMQFIIDNAPRNKGIDEATRKKYDMKKHAITLLDATAKSPTITSLPDDYVHYSEPRILTVREYARIQSFPDWYAIKGKYTTGGPERTSTVPRYTQIGNAIPPLFGQQSGLALKELLNG